jgi:protein TonB
MKNLLVLFVFLSSFYFYAQEKIYFTEDFKELPSADNAIYYTIYEESPEGTVRTTCYLDNSLFTKDHFSNYKRRILNGTSQKWHKNGNKKSVFLYVKGKQAGIQTRYYENGQVKRTESFKNGEFVAGKCFDENGTEIEFFPYYIKPEFPGGMKAFYDYVANNFKSPNGGKGEIKIGFYVELDGTLNHFEVIKSINKEMDLSAIRLLLNSKRWTPGKVDGREARVKYSIPITIR